MCIIFHIYDMIYKQQSGRYVIINIQENIHYIACADIQGVGALENSNLFDTHCKFTSRKIGIGPPPPPRQTRLSLGPPLYIVKQILKHGNGCLLFSFRFYYYRFLCHNENARSVNFHIGEEKLLNVKNQLGNAC